MSYSGGSGGTLTLPSPTHVHHVDMTAAVRSLRRSMSRSPSRFGMVRTASGSTASTDGSPSTTPQSSPTPTPPRAFTTFAENSRINFDTPGVGQQGASTSTPQTTAFTPFRTGVKLSVRSARPRPQTARPLTRTRASPKSPLKRVFGASSDSGNFVPPSTAAPVAQSHEDALATTSKFRDFALGFSPVSRRNLEKPSRHSVHLDVSGASTAISKFLEVKNEGPSIASASPLKRSDALMNLDQSSLGSPVAKRRSLHGIASFGNDFNIFDHPPPPTSQPSFEIHEDATNHEYQLTGSSQSLFRDQVPPPTPTVTRRASSLRKTTLQQRHGDGRTSWGRRQGEKQLSNMANDVASPAAPRNRPRLSLDQYLPPEPRGSPFTAHHPLPHPSVHMFGGVQNHPRHPLSRTITQSSSGSSSSVPDESPTHFPVTFITDKPRVPLNFSKSVPIGSQRPSDGNVVSTPAYKSAKPDPNAFASTGLVSKVGRRAAEAERLKLDTTASTPMPDTPCKKQHYPANTFPPQSSASGRRSGRPSFAGSPSTPFNSSWKNPPAFPISFGNSDRLGGLFKARNAHSRRSSLLSIDGDDAQGADGDFIPPTPTKNLFFKPPNAQTQPSTTPNGSPNASRFLPASISTTSNGPDAQVTDSNCKSPRPYTFAEPMAEKTQSPEAAKTPLVHDRDICSFLPLQCILSFPHSRANREHLCTPIPLKLPFKMSVDAREKVYTKSDLHPATPLDHLGNFRSPTPTTPLGSGSMVPPDPSRLSISNSHGSHSSIAGVPSSAHPPATPTTQGRMSLSFIGRGERRVSIASAHDDVETDHDLLSRRFDKAEPIGSGEFSHVFKVTKSSYPPFAPVFATTPGRHTPSSPRPSVRVYVVKKICAPITGPKDRKKRYHEVSVLKALSQCDHVVRYFESWEENHQLYIQTEYCEEGSLGEFLDNVGKTGRLDDFRIWKIMLELCYVCALPPLSPTARDI